MIKYGKNSRSKIAELDGRLQRLLDRYSDSAPADLDLSIICGHRGEAEQNAAYNARPQKSKTPWPKSKHNSLPARAFDFTPYPFDPARKDWTDIARFARVAGALQMIAAQEKINIRWGGDFSEDGRTIDEKFVDAGHIELDDG